MLSQVGHSIAEPWRKSPPLSWPRFDTQPLWQCRLRCTWPSGFRCRPLSDSQAALRRALPGEPAFCDSSTVGGRSRRWRFEVWNSGAGYSQGGTQGPGMRSLPWSCRARSVCLQGTVQTHLFTGACFWVAALWRLPSPTSLSRGSSSILLSSLPLHMEGLMLAKNGFIIGLASQRTQALIYSMWRMINILYKWQKLKSKTTKCFRNLFQAHDYFVIYWILHLTGYISWESGASPPPSFSPPAPPNTHTHRHCMNWRKRSDTL